LQPSLQWQKLKPEIVLPTVAVLNLNCYYHLKIPIQFHTKPTVRIKIWIRKTLKIMSPLDLLRYVIQVHGIFQARSKNWVGSNSDLGRKSVWYPYGTSGIRTIQLNSGTGFFQRPVSEIGEKKSFFRIRDVRYGYWTSSTGTGLFSGSGSNIYIDGSCQTKQHNLIPKCVKPRLNFFLRDPYFGHTAAKKRFILFYFRR